MKNIRKVLAVTSIVSALTLGFSPAQAAPLSQKIEDTHASSASATNVSPAFFHWLCELRRCN